MVALVASRHVCEPEVASPRRVPSTLKSIEMLLATQLNRQKTYPPDMVNVLLKLAEMSAQAVEVVVRLLLSSVCSKLLTMGVCRKSRLPPKLLSSAAVGTLPLL